MDSLHQLYKEDRGTPQNVDADSWQDRGTLLWPLVLAAGTQTVKVTWTNDFDGGGRMYLDRLRIVDAEGLQVATVEFEDLGAPVAHWGHCGETPRNPATGQTDFVDLWGGYNNCAVLVNVEVPATGVYTAEVVAWSTGHDERYQPDGYAQLAVIANPYEEGDTWYRDMRIPAFSGEQAPVGQDSIQWLAQQIVDDRRFAEAVVKFWWPAIMGSAVVEPPAEEGDADFEGQLLAANAQSAEVRRLAYGFRQGFHGGASYNLKDLLVEMVLSKWFRADALDDSDPVRRVALRRAGARRLLTPEELARKTAALTDYQWGRGIDTRCSGNCDPFPNKLSEDFRLLYGGIDSDGITKRARNMTSVMAGVAKRHAVRTSCPVVLREFFLLPAGGRRLFVGIDKNVTPDRDVSTFFEIAAEEDWETLSGQVSLPEGSSTLRLSFTNDYWDPPDDRNVRIDRLDLRDSSGRVVASYELEDLEPASDCNHPVADHFGLHCPGLVDVPVKVPKAGDYTLEIVARADQVGDELARLDVWVVDVTLSGAGAVAIREKLVELHERLLGVEVTPHSQDVDAAFELFVDVMERGRSAGLDHFNPWECDFWEDIYFLDGIVYDIPTEGRYELDLDWDRLTAYMDTIDKSDKNSSARAWGVVLTYLLTDYRYLQL